MGSTTETIRLRGTVTVLANGGLPRNMLTITPDAIGVTRVLSDDIWVPLSPGDRVRGHQAFPILWRLVIECASGSWPDGHAFMRGRGRALRQWFETNPRWEVEETTELFEKGYWATYLAADAADRSGPEPSA